jgi:hypothetical protein
VSKELPVTVGFDVPIPTVPAELQDLLDVNPPSESLNYSLSDVEEFSDALDDLQEFGTLEINSISYEITGIEGEEGNIDLDEFSISLNISNQSVQILSNAGGLSNVAKTEIPLTDAQLNDLENELFNNGNLGAEVLFDLASVPTNLSELNMDFSMYFDVSLKIRDLEF